MAQRKARKPEGEADAEASKGRRAGSPSEADKCDLRIPGGKPASSDSQDSIRVERDRFFGILNAMTDGVYIINRQRDLEYVNAVMEKELGPWRGLKCYQYLCRSNGPCPLCKYDEVFSGKTVRWEWNDERTGRVYDCIDAPLNNPDGSISKVKILRDISEHKRIGQEIQNLARFPSENPFPVLRISKSGTVLYCNKAGYGLLDKWGIESGGVVPPQWRRIVKRVFASGDHRVEEVELGNRVISFVLAFVPDAGYVNVYGRDITARKEAEADLRKAQSELEDKVRERTAELGEAVRLLERQVEQRKTAEQLLRERSRTLDAFFAHTITPLVIFDKECNFIRVNVAYADACNRDVSEFPGHNHFEFYADEENQRLFEEVVRTKTPHRAVARPFSLPERPEWGVTYWDWTLVPILGDDEEVEFLVFSLEDVTARQRSAIELAESEARYRDLFDLSPDAIVVVVEEKVAFANSACSELVGTTKRKELIGQDIWTFVPDDSREVVQELLRQVIVQRTKVLQTELRLLRLSGESIDVEMSASPIMYQRQPAMQVVLRDVTERRRQQTALQLSESRLAEAQRIAHLGNWDWDIVEDTLWWSDEVYRIFGLQPKQFDATYEAFLSYVHSDDRDLVESAVGQALRKHSTYSLDHRVVRPDGVVRVVHEQAETSYDSEGRAIRMMGTVQDVTVLRQKEAELRESEQRFRLLTESIEDVFWISTPGVRRVIYVSPAYEKIWGRSRESLYEDPLSFIDAVHSDDRKRLEKGLNGHARGQWDHEYRIVRPDECVRWIRDRGFPIYDQDGNVELMCRVATDISEQKGAEERILADQAALRSLTLQLQLAEERERRQLASDLHDSIGQILAFSRRELLGLEKLVPPATAMSLKEVGNQLDKAVKQTRTLSFELSPSVLYDLGLEVALEDVAEWFSREHKIESRFHDSGEPKPVTDAVKILLYRSVRELLVNVAKHAEATRAEISLASVGDYIHVNVEDNGKGFDMSALDCRSWRSKGFGLFTIRERLRHIGGHLDIKAAQGGGTRITLEAPLSTREDGQKG